MFTLLLNVNGQTVYTYNAPGSSCYCELLFEEEAISPKGVIVLDAEGENLLNFSSNNQVKNSKLFNDYNFLYLNILNFGKSTRFDCYQTIIRVVGNSSKITLSSFYLIQRPDQPGVVLQNGFNSQYSINILYVTDTSYLPLLKTLNQISQPESYRIKELQQYNSEERFEERMANYNRNVDLQFFYAPTFLTGNKLGMSNGLINTYGLSFQKNVTQRLGIRLAIGASIKRPDPSLIQSRMQGNMMSAIQSGEDSLIIDESIFGHIMGYGEIGIRYYSDKTTPFRWYLGSGVGLVSSMSMGGRFQDTIDISGFDMNNPSSMQSSFGGGDGANQTPENMNMSQNQFIAPFIEYGFEYRLAPPLKLNVSLPVRYSVDLNHTNQNTLSFALNLGLSFTLNPGKVSRLKKQ